LIGCLVGFLVFGPFVGLGVWVSLVFLWFLGVISGFVLGVSLAVLCIIFVFLEALCAPFFIYNTSLIKKKKKKSGYFKFLVRLREVVFQ
jgi:LytS/YehU family sensor histidine kinase